MRRSLFSLSRAMMLRSGHAKMSRTRGMDVLQEFWHAPKRSRFSGVATGFRWRSHSSTTMVAHRGRSPTMERTCIPGATVGEAARGHSRSHLPHPRGLRAFPVHGRSNPEELLEEIGQHVLVDRVRLATCSSKAISPRFWQYSHPGGAVGLLEIAAGGQRGAAVEDPDIVQAQEAAFEDVLAERGPCGSPTRRIHA